MDTIVDDESIISFISEIELQVWNPADTSDMLIYTHFISESKIILPDEAVIKMTIDIRKNHKLKIGDAIIAATAMVNELTLVADNDKDFKRVPGLKYINPATM